MKIVGAFEAKTHLSRLLREVEETREAIVITNRGKKVACLSPYQAKSENGSDLCSALEGLAEVREAQSEYNGDIRDLIEDGRKR